MDKAELSSKEKVSLGLSFGSLGFHVVMSLIFGFLIGILLIYGLIAFGASIAAIIINANDPHMIPINLFGGQYEISSLALSIYVFVLSIFLNALFISFAIIYLVGAIGSLVFNILHLFGAFKGNEKARKYSLCETIFKGAYGLYACLLSRTFLLFALPSFGLSLASTILLILNKPTKVEEVN